MNGTPHAHEPYLSRCDDIHGLGGSAYRITYGDTNARLLPAPFGAIALRRPLVVKYATKRAIRKHDRGSREAAAKATRRKQRRNKTWARQEELQAIASQVHSDWYMDSQERMDKLHIEALILNSPAKSPSFSDVPDLRRVPLSPMHGYENAVHEKWRDEQHRRALEEAHYQEWRAALGAANSLTSFR